MKVVDGLVKSGCERTASGLWLKGCLTSMIAFQLHWPWPQRDIRLLCCRHLWWNQGRSFLSHFSHCRAVQSHQSSYWRHTWREDKKEAVLCWISKQQKKNPTVLIYLINSWSHQWQLPVPSQLFPNANRQTSKCNLAFLGGVNVNFLRTNVTPSVVYFWAYKAAYC